MAGRRFRRLVAAAGILAVAATLVGPCDCLPQPAAAAEHACCAPPAGYRSADPGCCPEGGATSERVSALSPQPLAAPTFVAVASVALSPVLSADHGHTQPLLAVSPPLTVRRL